MNKSFINFLVSHISLTLLASIFTYRLINSLLDNIIFPLLDLTILPLNKYNKMSYFLNNKKQKININHSTKEKQYVIRLGLFLREFIIWLIAMIVFYLIYLLNFKNNN